MSTRRQFQIAGLLILILGLLSAGAVYWAARQRELKAQTRTQAAGDGSDVALSPGDSKVYARDTEINMGKGAIAINAVIQSVGQLFAGENLAFTLAVASIVAAGGCFALADLSPSK